MANKQSQSPLVSSVSTTLRKTINSTQVVTPDEVREKKKDMLSVIDKSLNIFKNQDFLSIGRTTLSILFLLKHYFKYCF